MNADKEKGLKQAREKQFPHRELTEKILQAAFAVSNTLGCGFLEKVYENALTIELEKTGLKVARQVPTRILYREQTVGEYTMDLVVENAVLVEIKATIEHHKVYEAQTINYLRATGLQVGLLLNFGRPKLVYRRFAHTYERLNDIPGTLGDAWRPV